MGLLAVRNTPSYTKKRNCNVRKGCTAKQKGKIPYVDTNEINSMDYSIFNSIQPCVKVINLGTIGSMCLYTWNQWFQG